MRYLITPDSFKGSLTSLRAAEIIARAIHACDPLAETDIMEVADGGEGTLAAIRAAVRGEVDLFPVSGLTGGMVEAPILILPEAQCVFIESATCIGLTLVPESVRNPDSYDSFGFGQLLHQAFTLGYPAVYCALGGTATNDCGYGLARGLGYSFEYDRCTEGLPTLEKIKAIQRIRRNDNPVFRSTKIIVLSDVTNPLLGAHGATYTFGPQKGVQPNRLQQFDAAFEHFASIVNRDVSTASVSEPGAGAAGGLGFALRAFCNASTMSGIDEVLRITGFKDRCRQADVIITGEGKIDSQSKCGKAIAGISNIAARCGKPVFAFAGRIDGKKEHLLSALGLNNIFAISPDEVDDRSAIEHAEQNLERSVVDNFQMLR